MTNNNSMTQYGNNQQNASQSFKDYRTRIGHYNTLAEALAAAMLKGNLVWRIYDETREPFDLAPAS